MRYRARFFNWSSEQAVAGCYEVLPLSCLIDAPQEWRFPSPLCSSFLRAGGRRPCSRLRDVQGAIGGGGARATAGTVVRIDITVRFSAAS